MPNLSGYRNPPSALSSRASFSSNFEIRSAATRWPKEQDKAAPLGLQARDLGTTSRALLRGWALVWCAEIGKQLGRVAPHVGNHSFQHQIAVGGGGDGTAWRSRQVGLGCLKSVDIG